MKELSIIGKCKSLTIKNTELKSVKKEQNPKEAKCYFLYTFVPIWQLVIVWKSWFIVLWYVCRNPDVLELLLSSCVSVVHSFRDPAKLPAATDVDSSSSVLWTQPHVLSPPSWWPPQLCVPARHRRLWTVAACNFTGKWALYITAARYWGEMIFFMYDEATKCRKNDYSDVTICLDVIFHIWFNTDCCFWRRRFALTENTFS